MDTKAIATLNQVTKTYGHGPNQVLALNNVSVDFYPGQFTAIMGPSGSGKSTLVHCLAALDTVDQGQILLNGQDLTQLSDRARTLVRREQIGFVFQSFNLLPMLDAQANILLPLKLAGTKPDPDWFNQVTNTLGITSRLHHLPSQMSGGQVQRVAVARALMTRPALIVADEPTGNLDSTSSAQVLDLLRTAVDHLNQTVVMVTHDYSAAARADRVIVMHDGSICADLTDPQPETLREVA